MKLSNKEMLQDTLWILAGNIALAMGVAWFILPNDVLTGGLAGVAIALEPLIHLNPELVINVLTVVLFLAGSVILGKKFAAKTILSTICYPLLLTLLSYLAKNVIEPDTFIMDKYLATIYGGALMGIGVGCVFRTGASTGGMDIPPLIINKYTHIPLPTLVLIVDALTVLLGAAVYGLQAALTGILSVWVSSYMINKTMMIGGHDARNVMIVSNKHKEIMDRIHEALERGTTILEATGGYSSEKRPVIMAVVAKKQLPELQHLVSHIDPEAFVIVMEANEVQGLGFTYEEEL
ncbi:YitT family protein [[Clostridium] innocuum]|nr:YitT family protein [[Clostridium] innocuum]